MPSAQVREYGYLALFAGRCKEPKALPTHRGVPPGRGFCFSTQPQEKSQVCAHTCVQSKSTLVLDNGFGCSHGVRMGVPCISETTWKPFDRDPKSLAAPC